MADDQQLSPEEYKQLQDIAAQLPTGHPAQAKVAALLASQPTQFEKDRSGGGYLSGLKESLPSAGSIARRAMFLGFDPASDVQAIQALGNTPQNFRTGAKNISDIGVSNLPARMASGAVNTLGPLVGVDPQSMAARAERGDTSGIYGQVTIPAATALSPLAVRGARAIRSGIGNAAFEPTSSTFTPSESPTGSMIEYGLKPGVSKALRVAGAATGAAAGALPGIVEGKPYLAYGGGSIGAGTGAAAGPSMFEAMFKPQPKPVFPGASSPTASDFYAARGAEVNSANNIAAKFARNQAKAQAALAKVPDWEQPAHDVLELGSPENPGPMSKIPSRVPSQFRGDPFAPQTEEQANAAPRVPRLSDVPYGSVIKVPEPNEAFAPINPKYMASVPRNELVGMARSRTPGAGTQLQQIGNKVIYTPPEGYPPPKEVIPQGNATPFAQPTAQPYTITNEMGIRWANSPGLPKISIPNGMAEADIPSYVAEKQALQKKGIAELFQ